MYERIASESDFADLRRRYRRFAFPATIAFMAWYILYIVCNNWARDFMGTKVVGNINVALIFGLLQFVSTFVIAFVYSRYSTKNLDPCPPSCAMSSSRRSADERVAARPHGHGKPIPHHCLVPRGGRPDVGHHLLGVPAEQDRADYYAGGRSFSGFQNGLAIGGDYMSAASFLGISGSSPVRLRRLPLLDRVPGRLAGRAAAGRRAAAQLRPLHDGRPSALPDAAAPVRDAAAHLDVVVSIFYLLAQMVGAGALVALLLGVTAAASKNLVIVGVGV
jgi:uncharacterized membrane protein (DUF485 family)